MYTKSEIRRMILKQRNSFSKKEICDKKILNKLISECENYNKIFVYISYSSEVDTLEFISYMLEMGKEIFVPVCNISTTTMHISRIKSLNELHKNAYGILEPDIIDNCNDEVEVVVFPGVAFDISGSRIGYGKGYYDKYISKLKYSPYKIGICYDFQLLNEIPSEIHDIKLNKIITESRTVSV